MAHNKILSQAGTSLADLYDVEGSIVGIEDLESDGVKTVHEMGGVIVSERLGALNQQVSSGAIAQSLNFNATASILGTHNRLLSLAVVTTPVDRLVSVQVSITTPPAGGSDDNPIWWWDVVGDTMTPMRIMIAASVSGFLVLNPTQMVPMVPNLIVGSDAGGPSGPLGSFVISLRGTTTAFGAGTVTTIAVLNFARPAVDQGQISNRGLPLPSW